ncbi:GNAT family N-acetyltransferase [Sphingomonas floccifaciens]|uniref:GNAT family N-acetyltransferase n=1 Tax=Sphingomonas floccifaciens TaxID=1844115 RepID=A0ABW4N7L4_9SPHN
MSYTIRAATGGDVAAIEALLAAAFPEPAEAMLVRRLCIDGDMVLTLVADDEETGALAGMIAFSRMAVEVDGKPVPAVALAPIATAAAHRRRGIADLLIRTGLRDLAAAGVVLCFVLGEPDFYGRHGFSVDWAKGFDSPYAGDYLMALPLQDGKMPCGVRGVAVHAKAFASLGEEA